MLKKTGLVLTPGTNTKRPHLSGTFRGRDTYLYTVRRGTRRWRRTYTVISMDVNIPAKVYLSVSGEGLLSGIAKSLGMQDIQVNDQEFDQRFVIRNQPEIFAVELFREVSLRRHLPAMYTLC